MFGFGGMGMGGYPRGYGMPAPMYGSPYDPMGMSFQRPESKPTYQKTRAGSVCSEASTAVGVWTGSSVSSSSTPRSDSDAQSEVRSRAASDRPPKDALSFGKMIGEGDFSVVYRGTLGSRPVAIKVLEKRKQANHGRNCKKDWEEEVSALKQVQYPGCLELLHAFDLTIVTDLAEGKPMKTILYDEKQKFPPAVSMEIVRQLAGSVAHLHSIPLLHRDIKPENVMVTDTGKVKLIDFGMCQAPVSGVKKTTFDGSPLYGAPEALGGHPATCKSEVWTLACVCAEAFGCGRPYSTQQIRTLQELAMKAQAGDKPFPMLPGVPANAQQILQRCFTRAADSRPDAAELAQV